MRQVELVDIRGCMFGREEEAVNAVAGWLLRRRRCGAASETVSGTGLSSMGVGESARQRLGWASQRVGVEWKWMNTEGEDGRTMGNEEDSGFGR